MSTTCEVCGSADLIAGDDSFLYCQNCGTQSTQCVEEGVEGESRTYYNAAFKRESRVSRNLEYHNPGSLPSNGQGEALVQLQDGQDATRWTPTEFYGSSRLGTDEDVPLTASQFGQGSFRTERIPDDALAGVIRSTYVDGVQRILQLQCETLVKQFGVTPLICGIMGPIWLKYVASTRVFEKAWAEEVILVAEHQERMRKGNKRRVAKVQNSTAPKPTLDLSGSGAAAAAHGDGDWDTSTTMQRGKKREKKQRTRKGPAEPRTSFGRKSRFVWLGALKERIPLSITLALCYLCCYVAREPVLPTDITKWASEGQLPYLAAFVEISKPAPHHISNTVGGKYICPIAPMLMFRPDSMLGSRRLELQAGFVAERVAIHLPPVNFHAISGLLLSDTRLPVEQLSAYACRLYEWYTPKGLWLSAREAALPTRVYVMSMLVIAIKILYKLDGCTLQEGEETYTQKNFRRLLSSKEEGHDGHRQSLHMMLARESANGKAGVEACENKQQKANPAETIGEMERGGTNASDDHLSAQEVQILGKRKRLPRATSKQRGGSKKTDDDKYTFGEASSPRLARLQKEQRERGDVKELIEILESIQAKNTTSSDGSLSCYLTYCQNVIFSGYDHDPCVEFFLEKSRGIHEEITTEATSKPVVDSIPNTSAGGQLVVASHLVACDKLVEDNAMGEYLNFDKAISTKASLQAEAHGGLEGEGSLQRDVPSTSSLRITADGRPELSKHNQQMRKNEIILHNGYQEAEFELVPAREVGVGHMKKQGSSRLTTDMRNAGFAYLPPLASRVGPDEYVRYSFQVPASGLIPVHTDYFQVLQACGKLVDVDAMALHHCVQILEKELLQVETNVEKFLLGTNGDVAALAEAVKRRKPPRRRNSTAEAENVKSAAERIAHLQDLSYI